ncbi:unnamed protein product [Moneuplotes crassus]|uniref:Uncharacterized protein n=1 Tax=Euplotes crassus TaxID=5936 RepID=A0AAD1U7B4_EUPCR|nr:unnamed protein product [Moneuplotes crassus]
MKLIRKRNSLQFDDYIQDLQTDLINSSKNNMLTSSCTRCIVNNNYERNSSTDEAPVKKVLNQSELKKKQKDFYYKQINFVENKYSKIYKKLIYKEKQLANIQKKNKPCLVSNGSRRILNAKKSCDMGTMSVNEILEFSSTGCKYDTGFQNNSKVHDRLYDDSNERKLRKTILTNFYQGMQHSNMSHSRTSSNNGRRSSNHSRLKTSRVTKTQLGMISPSSINYQTKRNPHSKNRNPENMSNSRSISKSPCNNRTPLKTSQRLYNDAIVRKKCKENLKFKIPPKHTFKNDKSSQYLIGQFLKDFNEASLEYHPEGNQDRFEIKEAFQTMQILGFIRHRDRYSLYEINSDKELFMHFWEEIVNQKSQTVDRHTLLQYTLAIEGFSFEQIEKNQKLLSLYSLHHKSIKKITTVVESTLDDDFSICDIPEAPIKRLSSLSNKEVTRIHNRFLPFARNRSDFNKLRSQNKYKRRESYDDNIRSKPEISKKSAAIASKIRQQFGDKDAKLVDIRNKSGERSKLKNARRSTQNFKNTYKKLSKTRIKKHYRKMSQGTSDTMDDIVKQPSWCKYKTNREGKPVGRGKPLLSVDVNFGENLKDQILIHNGDDLPELANDFAHKHHLSLSTEKKLVDMLEEKLKIEQEIKNS